MSPLCCILHQRWIKYYYVIGNKIKYSNMNKFKITISAFIFLTASLLISCGETTSNETDSSKDSSKVENTTNSETEINSTETTTEETSTTTEEAKFVCPGRCEEGKSATAGECSSCGMELIENSKQ